MAFFRRYKNFFFVLILLIISGFLLTKLNEVTKDEGVLADTKIPIDSNFVSPLSLSAKNDTSRIYKDLGTDATVVDFDKRVYVLDQYFAQYNSPLYGTAKIFVDACDKYNAPKDCTTTAAIAMNETHLCTYSNSAAMHNCWGFGGPAQYRTNFATWQDGINTVTDVLANQYGSKYMINPTLMEGTFCGPDPSCVGWGDKIKSLMDNINDFSKTLGMGDLFSLRQN